jgi:CTP:molybdopterin cytidylyltransferase MocA
VDDQQRSGEVAAVILAAGASSRMGRAKQVAVVDGEPMVVRSVKVALASQASQVWVVTGAHAALVEQALASIVEQQSGVIRFVHNAAWADGQAGALPAR